MDFAVIGHAADVAAGFAIRGPEGRSHAHLLAVGLAGSLKVLGGVDGFGALDAPAVVPVMSFDVKPKSVFTALVGEGVLTTPRAIRRSLC